MKVKCTGCGNGNYIVIGKPASTREGHIELRQCGNCGRRYRVLVMVGGIERLFK